MTQHIANWPSLVPCPDSFSNEYPELLQRLVAETLQGLREQPMLSPCFSKDVSTMPADAGQETAAQTASSGDHATANNQYEIGKYHSYEDNQKALLWFKKAADNGHAAAQHQVAEIYSEQRWNESDSAAREALQQKIMDYNGKARAQNYLPAIHALAESYRIGDNYCEQIDTEQAIKYHRIAAEQNYPGSQYALGLIFLERNKSPEEMDYALSMLLQAANQG